MTESEPLRVVVINGSPNEQSKTMGLVAVTLDRLSQRMHIDTRQIDVYRLGRGFSEANCRENVADEIEDELRTAERADLLIAATPIYRGSYTGLFKHFFDLIEQYTLVEKPVLLLATGGGDKHALALDHALRPLFASFQAHTLPVGVFASSGDFDGTTLLNPRVHSRITVALDDANNILSHRYHQQPEQSTV